MKIETTDLNFMDTEHVIASFLLLGDDSAALVETGPTTCLGSLMGGLKDRGVSPEDVRQVFLTHIHLDHSGPLATSRDCSRTLPSTCTRSATRTWWTLRSS
jgi:glyoxylase-like metal-dependent hydrolase (beta-lactamase superfamily II)